MELSEPSNQYIIIHHDDEVSYESKIFREYILHHDDEFIMWMVVGYLRNFYVLDIYIYMSFI